MLFRSDGTTLERARDRGLDPDEALCRHDTERFFVDLGDLFVTGPTTSSFDSVYKVDPHGVVSTFYRGLGRPQGMAFDREGNLYVAASLAGKR